MRSVVVRTAKKVIRTVLEELAPPAPPSAPRRVSDLVKPGDAGLVHPYYGPWPGVVPLPSPEMMATSGAPSVENFLVVGDAWGQTVGQYLAPRSSVLDIGCGCGKTARTLVHHPFVERYIGFDVLPECVEWCRRYVTPPSSGRFEFFHFDIQSEEYRPNGTIRASEFSFPAPDGAIDLALAASLFTHLLEPDAQHYLRELSRVLKPGGKAIVSIHIEPPPGQDFAGAEGRIDIRPEYFAEIAGKAGLMVSHRIGELCGQETFLLATPPPAKTR
jgi:SAM-dependent methyltransferase